MAIIFVSAAFAGCFQHPEGVACTDNDDCASNTCTNGVCEELDTEDTDTPRETTSLRLESLLGGLEGVDILVVVDNSSSMQAEQELLSSALFTLINELALPLDGSGPPTDNIHIAVTTSDMGLSWGGTPFDPITDGWPEAVALDGCEEPLGDNGALRMDYDDDLSIPMAAGQIRCTPTAHHCPSGWECVDTNETGEGTCAPVSSNLVACPPSPADAGAAYLSIDPGFWGVQEMALTASCLTVVGTGGCGFEQQLTAAVVAAERESNTDFMRPHSLLLVLVISDEEDCSIENGPAFFASQELQSLYRINTACGIHSEALYTPAEIKQMAINAKAEVSGPQMADSAVLFAAIVGVPRTPVCQGSGTDIAGCLDVALEFGTVGEPGKVQRLPPGTTSGPEASYFEFACERYDGDTPITQASSGTRFVQVAQEFGDSGYVSSICNDDWTPAMMDIAAMIKDRLAGHCFPETLAWDSATQTSACDLVMEFYGNDCPAGYDWSDVVSVGTEETPQVRCTLPKLPVPLECGATEMLVDLRQNEFGWIYCENSGENFSDACGDGIDNDDDGNADCADSGCAGCANCNPDGADLDTCPLACASNLIFTDDVLSVIGSALNPRLVCPVESAPDTDDCREPVSTEGIPTRWQMTPGDSDACCSTAQIEEAWWETADLQQVTCSDDNLSNCAPGQTCSNGLCTCDSSCDCPEGLCSSAGVCLPSACNGYFTCNCWGGTSWWSSDPQNTPALDAAARGRTCQDAFFSDEPDGDLSQWFEYI